MSIGETFMKTGYLVATLLTLAPLSAAAFAAPGDQQEQRSRFTGEDRAAFLDARIAGLKAGLELRADQEKNWPALETAIRDLAKEREERRKAWEEKRDKDEHADAMEYLTRLSDLLETRAADIKTLEAAAKPLYNSLDEAQKQRFGALLVAAMGPGRRNWHREE
jgi:hypothetical protein